MEEEKGNQAKEKGPRDGKTARKPGFFARFLARLAKENEKSGGQICRS
jgi:hypothetical protein